MKKIFFAMIVMTVVAVAFTACKGEKKAEKVAEPVVIETPAVETPAVEVSAEEQAFLAVVDKIDPANKCTVCHHAVNPGVGPSYADVAKVYKEKGGNLVKFLKAEADAIVLPERFSEMQANLEVTKKLSGDELATIATYIRTLE